MFTRCSGCHTTHPVNASLLARGGGRYRCGKCNKVCNALDALFDEWPGAGEQPPAAGDIPVLGLSIDLEQARKSRLEPDDATLTGEPDFAPAKKASRLLRIAWVAIAVIVAFGTLAAYTRFQEQSLADLPLVHSLMTRLGLLEQPAKPVFRDLDQIQLVSRELKSHPFKAGMLQLTATIVNRAPQPQPYPDLEVILLGSAGETLSRARFKSSDYLSGRARIKPAMNPGAFLPLVLELPDPGNHAVGFELNFRNSLSGTSDRSARN